MDVELKPALFTPDFDLEQVRFEDIFEASANTRYRFTIAKISKRGYAYTLHRRNKPFYYRLSEDDPKALPLWPDEKSCRRCMSESEILDGGEMVRIDKKQVYYELLPYLQKHRVFVGVYTNLKDVIELPVIEFKKDWFDYMFYQMKEDWMFDE